jgi:Lon protease-like protein
MMACKGRLSMTGDSSLPDNFSGQARLFPLPNIVLFPYVIQPLHIFEPRYRELMADALQDDRLIAMATLQPGWEPDYHNRPPVYPVICIGRVLKEESLPDGRYNFLLHGLSRARILDELPTGKAYRTARVRLLEDISVASPTVEHELRERLREHMNAWFASQSVALSQLRQLLESSLPLGTLCDIFSFTLTIDIQVKQELLEQLEVEQRVRRLLGVLGQRLQAAPDAETPRRFPPDFSAN